MLVLRMLSCSCSCRCSFLSACASCTSHWFALSVFYNPFRSERTRRAL